MKIALIIAVRDAMVLSVQILLKVCLLAQTHIYPLNVVMPVMLKYSLNKPSYQSSKKCSLVYSVTPNHLHFSAAKAGLESGFHVLSDKPATFTLEEVLDSAEVLKTSKQLYGLTQTFNGYPLIEQDKHLIAKGVLNDDGTVYCASITELVEC